MVIVCTLLLFQFNVLSCCWSHRWLGTSKRKGSWLVCGNESWHMWNHRLIRGYDCSLMYNQKVFRTVETWSRVRGGQLKVAQIGTQRKKIFSMNFNNANSWHTFILGIIKPTTLNTIQSIASKSWFRSFDLMSPRCCWCSFLLTSTHNSSSTPSKTHTSHPRISQKESLQKCDVYFTHNWKQKKGGDDCNEDSSIRLKNPQLKKTQIRDSLQRLENLCCVLCVLRSVEDNRKIRVML